MSSLQYYLILRGCFRNDAIEPVRERLIALHGPLTLLRVALATYPPGAWLKVTTDTLSDADEEEWSLRSTILEWAWRALAGLKDNGVYMPSRFGLSEREDLNLCA